MKEHSLTHKTVFHSRFTGDKTEFSLVKVFTFVQNSISWFPFAKFSNKFPILLVRFLHTLNKTQFIKSRATEGFLFGQHVIFSNNFQNKMLFLSSLGEIFISLAKCSWFSLSLQVHWWNSCFLSKFLDFLHKLLRFILL